MIKKVMLTVTGMLLGGAIWFTCFVDQVVSESNSVAVCHFPPDNPDNFHTIFVSEKAAAKHIVNHGDFLGECCPNGCPVDACTQGGCIAGYCVYEPISCDDSDPCTEDSCDPEIGCINIPIICPPTCVKPIGVEAVNFENYRDAEGNPIDIPNLIGNYVFNPPFQITLDQESLGGWGKIDLPDETGTPVNMSSETNFIHYMLGPGCFGTVELGNQYDAVEMSGVFISPLVDVFEQLVGERIVLLLTSPFLTGKKPLTAYKYAIVTVESVSSYGANIAVDLSIEEVSDQLDSGDCCA